MSTHSSEMLYEMDEATLIRLSNTDKTIAKSSLYRVDEKFSKLKRELNESLTTALFSDRVLLIEGPSEKVLFEKVLSEVRPNYELDGGYVLQVDGIKFRPYFEILTKLGIVCIAKTDNDLRKSTKSGTQVIETIGYNRCANLAIDNFDWEPETRWQDIGEIDIDYATKKIEIYGHSNVLLLKEKNIYLSKIDLENDLNEVLYQELNVWRNQKGDAVDYLRKEKLKRMLKLCDFLETEHCQKIYNHDLFECLKKLTGEL